MPDLVSLLILFVFFAGIFWTYKAARRALSAPDGLYSIPSGPYSRETPEEALRRSTRSRRAAEHDLWDSQYRALLHSSGGCSCHGRPLPRSSSRRIPFM